MLRIRIRRDNQTETNQRGMFFDAVVAFPKNSILHK